ncbi:MAG: hypothetical protein HC897_11030 [Thermoanaerobaculia bacterium]|nr:hypothetical protein [Thermoanaerobaculia bacterium]
MVALSALWLPIALSAVFVFVASALFWMVLPHHRSDWKRLPNEDSVMGALAEQEAKRGQYSFPFAASSNEWKSEEWRAKVAKGPCGLLVVLDPGGPSMGKNLALQFGHDVVISVFVAYLSGLALAPGTPYLEVFRVAGTAAVLGYVGALFRRRSGSGAAGAARSKTPSTASSTPC